MKKLIAGILLLVTVLCLSGCTEESERNKIGSSIDWGDDYYWDSGTESVEKKIKLW